METKKCSKCGLAKGANEFYKKKWYRDIKYHSICRKCTNLYRRNWQQTPKGKYASIKGSAKERKIEWGLTFEQFITFWQKPCYYCGDILKTIGLDRVDSAKGYFIDNVVSCCAMCNRMKRDTKQKEFLEKCQKIVSHLCLD